MEKQFQRIRYLLPAVLLLSVIFWVSCVAAGSPSDKTRIRVGYTDKGMMIKKQGDSFVGYGVDYLNLLSQYTNWDYEFVPVKESSRIRALKEGSIDLLCDLSEDEAVSEDLLLSEDKNCLHYALLCAKEDDTSVFYNEFSALNKKRVAINKSRKMELIMDEFARLHNLSYTPVYCQNISELESAVNDGRADLMVASNQRDLSGFKYVAKIGLRNQYFAVSSDQPELMAALNDADRQVKLAQPFIISNLYAKWYGRPAEVLVGETRDEYDFVKNQVPVRVVYDADSFPVEYQDEETGNFMGIYANALELVQKELGLNLQFLPVKDYREAWDMMKNGEADMLTGNYLSEELKKQYGILSSTSHLAVNYTLIMRKDRKVEDGLTLVLPEEDIDIQNFAVKEYQGLKIITGKDSTACLEMANRGDADGTLINSVFLQTVYKFSNYRNLRTVPMHSVNIPVSFGFAGENAELLCQMFNKVILRIPASSFEKCIIETSVETVYDLTLTEILERVFPALFTVLTGFVLFYVLSLHYKEKHYRQLAMTDTVTGLWNNICFRQKAREQLSRYPDTHFRLISMDIEHFRYVNADFGEKAADLLLQILAERIRNIFSSKAVYAREMGDIFLILSESCEDFDEILRELSCTVAFNINGVTQHYRPELKFGICDIPAGEERLVVSEYIDRANAARKSIKRISRVNLACFDASMENSRSGEMQIEKKMASALANRDFQVYYQPKYDLQTGCLAGAEALVRWIDPEEGMIYPGTFIPLFERNGFIVQLDFYVYEEVLRTLSGWLKKGLPPITVSVNVSRVHIGTGDFLSRLCNLADSLRVPRNLLELELTETVLGGSHQDIRDFVYDCRDAGFPISIDDFGTGYSSLNLLKELPIDVLKIDREFLNETSVSEKSSVIIRQIVIMAERLNIKTLCEGVETREQAAFLKEIGCNLAQGYLYSRPVPLKEFEAICASPSAPPHYAE